MLFVPLVSALLSFLGGSAFRMVWGEVSNYFNKKQDHSFEMERLDKQNEIDQAQHGRMIEMLTKQAELKVQVVQAQAQGAVDTAEAQAFANAMQDAFKPTGNFWVDLWNGVIRPACATVVLVLWIAKLVHNKFVMDDWDLQLCGAVLGFFFADRSLAKRGK